MSDAISDLRKANEESYFDKKNREALERMKKKKEEDKPRLSPITGEDMEQVRIHGVVVDKCKTSGGIWLDAGELEELAEAISKASENEGGVSGFFKGLL